MILSIILQLYGETVDNVTEDLPRYEQPVSEEEVERTSAPVSSPPVPPPTALAPP